MAEVYEVEHALTRRHLALKLLRPEVLTNAASVERFYREASVCAGIDSDHIVSVVDCDVDKPSGVPFLVMELLQGKDLAQYLGETTSAGGALSPTLVLQLMKQVASALDKVHAQGIVHRDLKPANLFLTFPSDGPPRVKILDFGIAALVHEDQPTSSSKLGTPLYMAPEQLLTGATISGAADTYALALIVYELLVGVAYWEGNTAASLFAKIPDRAARPKPTERALAHNVQLPAAFDGWLLRCIDPDPARRPATAGAAVGDLLMIFDPKATQPPRPGSAAPIARVGAIAPRAPRDAGRTSLGVPRVARPLGAPEVPARAPLGGPTRRLSPVPPRPVAIPAPAPPPAQDAPPSAPSSLPPPAMPEAVAEVPRMPPAPAVPTALSVPDDPEELLTDDIEDLRATGVIHTAPAPAPVVARGSAPPPTPAGAARGSRPPSTPPMSPAASSIPPAPPPAAMPTPAPMPAPAPAPAPPHVQAPRVLDDGLSERATRRIVSRLRVPVSPEALTQRMEAMARPDEALTQRLTPVNVSPPAPTSSGPLEVMILASSSRSPAPRFDDDTVRAAPGEFEDLPPAAEAVGFDDATVSSPADVRFGDSTTPGVGPPSSPPPAFAAPAEPPAYDDPAESLDDAPADDTEARVAAPPPVGQAQPFVLFATPPGAARGRAEGRAEVPAATPAPDGMSARVDAAMAEPAPRVRRRIPRSLELASTAILPTVSAPKPVRSRTLGLATAGTVLLAALAGWVLLRDRPTRPVAALEGWRAPSPAEQATLANNARAWSSTLLSRRSARGFGPSADPASATGIDTARGLAALLGAHRAGHHSLGPQDQLDTLVALDRLRGERGWNELQDGAPVPTARATAWATLAYASMSELTQAETARVRVRVARDTLLRTQRPDGGFPAALEGPSVPETTLLATWALVVAEPQDPTVSPETRAATRRALAQVRTLVDAPPDDGWTPRHEALAVLTLARARVALHDADASDAPRFARFGRRLVARCNLPPTGEARCNARQDDAPGPRPVWWPWSISAAAVLLRGEAAAIDAGTRRDLGGMVRSELVALESEREGWVALPTAPLAEALLALSESTL